MLPFMFLDTTPDYSKLLLGSTKLFQLPLDVLLKNNLALSHFMDYMTSIGAHGYLCFYLNIEGKSLFVYNYEQ